MDPLVDIQRKAFGHVSSKLCCDVFVEERYPLEFEYHRWIVNIEAKLNTEYSSLPRPGFP